ncbi:MAG: hypothetical protein LBT89_03680 [Planctomycetaceae bacterium]|jgi:diacylglycerol kinase family enzyme|nr:hypothetical protein [Planctomycetaceae bacterium]
MKYLFIVKRSGDMLHEKALVAHIIRVCVSMHVNYDIVVTETFMQEESIVKLKTAALKDEPLRIIVCGTKETLHFTINGFLNDTGQNIEIGYLPYDGVYDVFSTFKEVNANTVWNVENLMYGDAVDMDAVKVNNRYCIATVNAGVDATYALLRSWIYSFLPHLSHKHWAARFITFFLEYTALLTGIPNKSVTMLLNGYEQITSNYLFFVFTNTRTYGAGYTCAADAESDDGQLNMYLMHRIPFWNMPRALKGYRSADVMKSSFMNENNLHVARRIVKADVTFDVSVDICLDGNVYMHTASLSIEVIPAALRFILPNFSIETSTSFNISRLGSVVQ